MQQPSPASYLGKTARDGSNWHPLIAHSADVAAVTRRLLQPDSFVRVRLEGTEGHEIDDPLLAFLIFLAALHDLGKANHSFQAMLRAALRGVRTRSEGHVLVVFRTLEADGMSLEDNESLSQVILDVLAQRVAGDQDFVPLLEAAIAHHGKPYAVNAPAVDTTALNPPAVRKLWAPVPGSTGLGPFDEIRRISLHAARWSGADAAGLVRRLPSRPAFTHLFAGLVTLADWIGSTVAAFPFAPEADADPDAYWQEAIERADYACRQIGVVATRKLISLPATGVYATLFPSVFGPDESATPTALQHHVATMALPKAGTCVLIESATGSGKTEAALALYARLRDADLVGGMMFALPTRATARAMHHRVRSMAAHLYGPEAPGVTLAVGGASPAYQTPTALIAEHALVYDDQDDVAAELANWSSCHAKKFLAAELVVGTIDQALLAALAVKHAHIRLAGISRQLLVVDEVHSHDRYMLEVLVSLLRFHAEAGGISLLMSATLASAARELLGPSANSVVTYEDAVRRPYPTVATLERDATWRDLAVGDNVPPRRAHWWLSDETAAIQAALAGAKAGARVCILRNTVRDAQATVSSFEPADQVLLWRPAEGGQPTAYHARFTLPDRAVLDERILASFGKGGSAGGSILVATQVIEQSLDVDFDLLVTDLAPVEILLQRLGRVHRHRERDAERPGAFREPIMVVIAPQAPFAATRDYRGPHGWGTVYQNLPALELTRRLIAQRPFIEVPSMNRALLEGVYHASPLDELRNEPGWAVVMDSILGRQLGARMIAGDSKLDFHQTYGQNASRFQQDERVRTRIGDDSIDVSIEPPAPCWYAMGETADTVPLPLWQLRGMGDQVDLKDVRISGAITAGGVAQYELGAHHLLRYEATGWRIVNRGQH